MQLSLLQAQLSWASKRIVLVTVSAPLSTTRWSSNGMERLLATQSMLVLLLSVHLPNQDRTSFTRPRPASLAFPHATTRIVTPPAMSMITLRISNTCRTRCIRSQPIHQSERIKSAWKVMALSVYLTTRLPTILVSVVVTVLMVWLALAWAMINWMFVQLLKCFMKQTRSHLKSSLSTSSGTRCNPTETPSWLSVPIHSLRRAMGALLSSHHRATNIGQQTSPRL